MCQKMNVAMVSDYFYPATGGIETHIRYLSEELIKLGHKVVVITHKSGGYVGLHRIGSLKVYFLDIPVFCMNTTFPTLFTHFVLFRQIFQDEEIDIVHGHQTMSNLCMEGLFHAATLNLRTVLTEHSVFEIGPFENILVNALCRFILKGVDRAICVSYTSKENVHLRTEIPLESIYVIPNAMISKMFYPREKQRKKEKVVMVISRLVFRKGIDLLIGAIPLICKADPDIRIVIVGNGPKKEELEQMVDEHGLMEKIRMMQEVSHNKVGDLMRMGDIFLNTSLTETFCIAIMEAASCGLHVVSTNVGGIHEVLPPDMITFSRCSPEDLAKCVVEAAARVDEYNPMDYNKRLKGAYNWRRIAVMTEDVYRGIKHRASEPSDRICAYSGISGFICRFLAAMEYLWLWAMG
jgi:phosphatidylinositol N-acetylglucosaminyltransferase subunit A